MSEKIVFGGFEFTTFCEADIDGLTPIMKAAFDHDTFIHTGEERGGPGGYDNGDLFRKYYLDGKHVSFKITRDGKPIGGLCVKINADNINSLESIFIDPGCQGKNLGKVVWDFIEQAFPDTVKWQVLTPAYSKRNIHFYENKCGFKVVGWIRSPEWVDEPNTCVLEKKMNNT